MWELGYKDSWAPKNWCFWTVVLEKTLESPFDFKEIQPVHPKGNQSWKDWCWSWNSNTLATWCKELTHLKRPWCWERVKMGGEGNDRGWDGWTASLTQWIWVWVNSRSWWRTGKPGVLQSMGSQRVGHNWATELNWTDCHSPQLGSCLRQPASRQFIQKWFFSKGPKDEFPLALFPSSKWVKFGHAPKLHLKAVSLVVFLQTLRWKTPESWKMT